MKMASLDQWQVHKFQCSGAISVRRNSGGGGEGGGNCVDASSHMFYVFIVTWSPLLAKQKKNTSTYLFSLVSRRCARSECNQQKKSWKDDYQIDRS